MKLFAKFAKTNPSVHPSSGLGYGCMGITSFYGDAMEEEAAVTLLKTVYDQGCRHFDTAEMYRNDDPTKHNEIYLGKFLKTVPRDSYSVATKFWPGECNYATIKEHLQQSLERLQLEYVDLYYCHRVTSLESGIEFAKAAKKLKEEGLIREVGLSEVSGKWLEQIHAAASIDAVQQEWSILTRSLEDGLVPVCKKLDIAVVAYSPLCRNLLVQKHEAPPADWRANAPRYQALEQNKKFAEQVHDMAETLNCTPAQICLAWLFQKAAELGVCVVPIPGTTKAERAIGNIQSVDVTLSSENMKVLNAMAKDVVGDRYPESFMKNGMTIEHQ
uniref:NADP-dependent oxidoreductase domain-containing protein n=1 Tax=Amphora coffeiformis TaxID=265554 RepID=A0A7S3L109_9STRA|mmetsp:Transcript_5391/g.10723  ORF Transcript_5391/g.10723 Transcript_5391/m.10723 type:complete len:329 (-) Transcript_5391:95-1081(-)|eukprot:scaffold11046_cov183-Amphora_coffeaeformis.AAC.14